MKKTVAIAGATLVAIFVFAIGVEVWARLTWDPKRGTPGFFESDAELVERLVPNYDGWFAGVPVHINSLGFRDTREYALEKTPGVFRIIVLGDSVTFGHGSTYEHSYPRLLEDRLKAWRPAVDWQVWNLGVPGYNTAQELARLLRDGPRFQPDLVVVGFVQNDLFGDLTPPEPSRLRRLGTPGVNWVRRNLYSYDWYRKRYLTLRYRFVAPEVERTMLEKIAENESLLAVPDRLAEAGEQALTGPVPLFPPGTTAPPCQYTPSGHVTRAQFAELPNLETWKAVVRRFQELNRTGAYRIVFFLNQAPQRCLGEDRFVSADVESFNDYFMEFMAEVGMPAVSSYAGFLPYRFSDMPGAAGHSMGNANAVKADVLFRFLSAEVLPPLLSR
jgi:lysophospholipase L1-like esterase